MLLVFICYEGTLIFDLFDYRLDQAVGLSSREYLVIRIREKVNISLSSLFDPLVWMHNERDYVLKLLETVLFREEAELKQLV